NAGRTVKKAGGNRSRAGPTGKHINPAILTCRKAGKDQQEFLHVRFDNLLVSSYQSNGDGNANHLPVDSVSLNFARILFDYHVQNASGSVQPGARVGYDLKEMKAV